MDWLGFFWVTKNYTKLQKVGYDFFTLYAYILSLNVARSTLTDNTSVTTELNENKKFILNYSKGFCPGHIQQKIQRSESRAGSSCDFIP